MTSTENGTGIRLKSKQTKTASDLEGLKSSALIHCGVKFQRVCHAGLLLHRANGIS